MYLTYEETIEVDLFKPILNAKLLAKKVDSLSDQLEQFLINGPDFSDEFEDIGAFHFEFNHGLDFIYVGYPHHLFDNTWPKNIMLNVQEPDDVALIQELMHTFLSNPKISPEINQRAWFDTAEDCNKLFFCEAWRKAEAKVVSDKLCFVDSHGRTSGYDCNTKSYLSASEVTSRVRNWIDVSKM